MSPDPCQSTGVTSVQLTWAGRKRVSPGLWRNGRESRARVRGKRRVVRSGEQLERGAGEQFEGHHRRGGVARQSEEELPAGLAEDQRLPGLNQYAIEIEFRAAVGEGRFHEVVLSRRYAAGEQQQVGLESLADQARGGVFVVARDGQDDGLAAGASDLGRERIAFEFRI